MTRPWTQKYELAFGLVVLVATATIPPYLDRLRPTRHRLHLTATLDDLGIYDWPVPLDLGDTLTLADGRRFRVVDRVDLDAPRDMPRTGREVDRLIEIAPLARPSTRADNPPRSDTSRRRSTSGRNA